MLVCKIFTSFSAVMENSETQRESFEQRVGHTKLSKLVSEVTAPTKDILQAGLDMAVEGKYAYRADTHSVYNTSAVAMLINWLLDLNSDLSQWLSDRLYDMCSYGAYNKQRCCTAGLMAVIIEVLKSSQEPGRMLPDGVEGEEHTHTHTRTHTHTHTHTHTPCRQPGSTSRSVGLTLNPLC